MSRKEELEKIIEDANAELAPLKQRATYEGWTRSAIREVKEAYQIPKEDLLVIVDEVYSQETHEEAAQRRLTDSI